METLGVGVGHFNIHFQIGSARTLTINFLETPIASWTFAFNISSYSGGTNPVLSYTNGFGITFPVYSDSILISIPAGDVAQMQEGKYYWELRRTDTDMPLLSGEAYFTMKA